MKTINKILKPFGLCLLKRKIAVKYIENNYILILVKQFVDNNQILFKDTILGNIIQSM